MNSKSNKPFIMLILSGAFAIGAVVLIILILIIQRDTKSKLSDIGVEKVQVEQWNQYTKKLKDNGLDGSGNDEEHLLNMKVIENAAKEMKVDGNLVNIRRTAGDTPGEKPKLSMEFRNAKIGSLVRYLRKLEEERFIVQRLWIYLGRDGKSWDARATLRQKP